MHYEGNIIRPPSEAGSLLIRVTRNCPWNRCLFCPAYKGTDFSRRSVAEIKADIDEMAQYHGGNGSHVTTAFFQDADGDLILQQVNITVPYIYGLTDQAPGMDQHQAKRPVGGCNIFGSVDKSGPLTGRQVFPLASIRCQI